MFQGERVLLRASTRDDLIVQCQRENDPEIWFLDGGTPKPTQLDRLLAEYDAGLARDQGDEIAWAIEADGHYIGHCSLHRFNAPARSCELSVEIGDRAYWGRGYGREVVRLLLGYAFEHRNLNRVFLTTHSENERAVRCYRSCGFVEEGRFRQSLWIAGHYVDGVQMAVLRDEWTG